MGNPNPVDGSKNLVHVGRFKGALCKPNRVLRQALIYAAEKSKNSKDRTLESYCTFLADERPELFVHLLGKIITLQAKINVQHPDQIDRTLINRSMTLDEMMGKFEWRIRSGYVPPTLADAYVEHADPEDEYGQPLTEENPDEEEPTD